VRDVHDAIQALGAEQAVVVGHDWGGIIAWYLAMWHPEVVRGLVVLDAPHPAAYVRELARPSSQLLRSWYAFAFQLPFLPEALLAAGDHALMDLVLRSGPARHDDVLDAYRAAFATRDAITAGIDYYRAYVRHPPPAPVPIRVPTRLIWALADPFLVPSLRHGLAPWVQPLDVVTVADAGHWLHHSHAAEVNAWLLEFLAALPETTDRAAA
jgi:pimeloyl-ACP methyl ester carboxylesterase